MEKEVNISAFSNNNSIGEINRKFFYDNGIFAINIIGSPGCGKTSVLEYMANNFDEKYAVIIGDVKTSLDSNRIIKAGHKFAYPIETGGGCHISPQMINDKISLLDKSIDYLFIENVGNLVCPSSFDLGEKFKIAVLSIPEGDEKVKKYPALFINARAVIINKVDLLEFMDYDIEQVKKDCLAHNPNVKIFETSAKTGQGFKKFFEFLRKERKYF